MYVKQICKDYCMNENQLSKRSGISRSTIHSNKKDDTSIEDIKTKNLHKLSKMTGASMDELYNRYKKRK